MVRPPDAEWVDPERWAQPEGAAPSAGRGAAWFVETPVGSAVLRQFRRGGMAARLARDSYVYSGPERTRSFAEFRLMETLFDQGLPVPEPLLASYARRGPFYRAALMTRRLSDAESLVERYYDGGFCAEDGVRVGKVIRQFHEAGVDHADLNAHNILLSEERVYLIDFDRGAIRPPGAWQQSNLDRLARSLSKLAMDTLLAPIKQGYG